METRTRGQSPRVPTQHQTWRSCGSLFYFYLKGRTYFYLHQPKVRPFFQQVGIPFISTL